MKPLRFLLAAAAWAAGASLPLSAAEPARPVPPRFSVGYMDASVDPRADFARYAFGAWQKANPVPPDKARWGSFNELEQYNQLALKGILEGAAARAHQPGSVEQKVGDFFESAMDTAAVDAAGLKPVETDLARVAAISSTPELARALASRARHHKHAPHRRSGGQSAGLSPGALPDRSRHRRSGRRRYRRRSAAVLRGPAAAIERAPARRLEGLSALSRAALSSPLSRRAVRGGALPLLRHRPARHARDGAALAALSEDDRRRDRRGLGTALRRALLPARGQGAHGRDDPQHHRGHARAPLEARMDDRAHPSEGARQVRPLFRQDRLSEIGRAHV